MAIETTCTGCGKQLSVGDEFAGRQARCPACGQIYNIPSAGPAFPPPPPPNDIFAGTGASFSGASSSSNASASVGGAEQFWMLAVDQSQYGPVDRANLNRWFAEGRVGPGYQIRQGEMGIWQPAELFKPSANPYESKPSANPYAAASPYTSTGPMQVYPAADQSGLVLAMGILSWIVCPICGVIAWVMGNNGLKEIAAGRMDPTNRGLMQVGYYLGMVSVIISCLCCGGYFLLFALAAVAGA